mmetsp:Transcript_853/g.5322  ORF Transcript_853/g.5322 Transcript_853/m.5322 type:complete len:485 (-) Transcript_853:1268-2722(-)
MGRARGPSRIPPSTGSTRAGVAREDAARRVATHGGARRFRRLRCRLRFVDGAAGRGWRGAGRGCAGSAQPRLERTLRGTEPRGAPTAHDGGGAARAAPLPRPSHPRGAARRQHRIGGRRRSDVRRGGAEHDAHATRVGRGRERRGRGGGSRMRAGRPRSRRQAAPSRGARGLGREAKMPSGRIGVHARRRNATRAIRTASWIGAGRGSGAGGRHGGVHVAEAKEEQRRHRSAAALRRRRRNAWRRHQGRAATGAARQRRPRRLLARPHVRSGGEDDDARQGTPRGDPVRGRIHGSFLLGRIRRTDGPPAPSFLQPPRRKKGRRRVLRAARDSRKPRGTRRVQDPDVLGCARKRAIGATQRRGPRRSASEIVLDAARRHRRSLGKDWTRAQIRREPAPDRHEPSGGTDQRSSERTRRRPSVRIRTPRRRERASQRVREQRSKQDGTSEERNRRRYLRVRRFRRWEHQRRTRHRTAETARPAAGPR